MNTIPKNIIDLVNKRNNLRKQNKYKAADDLRKELLSKGYKISDNKNGSKIDPLIQNISTRSAFISVLGSGIGTDTGRILMQYILDYSDIKTPRIVIISTPAGFQPNVEVVCNEVKENLERSLVNYHPKISILYANDRNDANNDKIVEQLQDVDIIYLGAGSPTYCVKNLKNTTLYNRIIEKIKTGSSLCLSSAATMAFSKYTLPVYEIYKVGEDISWVEGLDFFSEFSESISLIPHFNNNEGGNKTDTKYCYMGEKRFQSLLALLPKKTLLIGIDELTGFTLQRDSLEKKIFGKGMIHEFIT